MKRAHSKPGRLRPAQQQRGLATLVVVAALFLIVSLVAAYANRNLIFEQRTSANQFRSTLAFETAEAGVEWAVAQLNSGLMDASCLPMDNDNSGTQTSFRQRYLDIGPTGVITPNANHAVLNGPYPTCFSNGGDWQCVCPATGAPAVGTPPAGVLAPAFRVRLVQRPATRPGTVWLEVNACTSVEEACLSFPNAAAQAAPAPAGEARARAEVLLLLRSALPSPPVAALTARGEVDGLGTFTLANANQGAAANLALHSGGDLLGAMPTLLGAAGEPADASRLTLRNDALLSFSALPAGEQPNRFFSASFGALPEVYAGQPAALQPSCASATTCTADELRAALRRNPGRLLWVDRNVDLDAGALGSPDDPVFLVIEGPDRTLALDGGTVHGLVYGRSNELTVSGNGSVLRGALIAEGDFTGSAVGAGPTLVYDADVLNRLRWQHGSFVRVPGSWRDF